jgi:LacI family transcriptional regulator
LLSTFYFSEILSGIGVELGKHNYNLLLMFQSPQKGNDYVQLFRSQKIDGCIILGSKDVPGEVEGIQKLHELSLPYCLVNQSFEGHSFNSIDANHYRGSFEAVSLLLHKGFRKIAFLNGPSEYSNSRDRLKGYQDAHIKLGFKPNAERVFQGNYSRTSGLKASFEIGPLMPKIDAIFAGNDRMAIGLMQGLGELGFHVGHDYALIGYDDSDIARMVQPELSSVKVPFFEMGKIAAAKILDALLNGKTESFEERLAVTFIERASSKTLNIRR